MVQVFLTFLSTPSSQRATVRRISLAEQLRKISIHALFAEGDHDYLSTTMLYVLISIHALFAEGDLTLAALAIGQ